MEMKSASEAGVDLSAKGGGGGDPKARARAFRLIALAMVPGAAILFALAAFGEKVGLGGGFIPYVFAGVGVAELCSAVGFYVAAGRIEAGAEEG